MKIKVAAAAPENLPGQPGRNMTHVLAAITRARDDGASLLVLPAGLPEDMNQGAIARQAGKMTVYPLLKPSLAPEQLKQRHDDMDILCCSSDSPATVTSHMETDELAALASHDNAAVVVMACPLGGDGGALYTGRCVIAQNGAIVAAADGYVTATVSYPKRDIKQPTEGTVTGQPLTPWTPLPELLPRILRLQADGLARRMMAQGATSLSVTISRSASSLLALAACVQAVDHLKLSRRNIHAVADGNRAGQIASALGLTVGGQGGLAVDSADLTARAIEGVQPEHYAVNAFVPRYTAALAVRWWANTFGSAAVSVPVRSIVRDDHEPWELYDFLLHYSLLYDMSKWTQARLLEDTFGGLYDRAAINAVLDRFFDNYRRPDPCGGPEVFDIRPRTDLSGT